MRADENRYKDILDNLYDGVYFVDRQRRITYWNRGAERISGYKASQVLGKRCLDNFLNHVSEYGIQLCLNGCPLHATMDDGKPREAEVYLHHSDGHRIPVLVRTSPIRDADGEIIGAVESFSDNSSLLTTRRRVNRLEQTVLLDPLTGIGNRRFIDIRIHSAFFEYQQHRIPFGILFMDIDDFKTVNDRFGHEIGDRSLQLVASTLKHNLRGDDAVARSGRRGVHRPARRCGPGRPAQRRREVTHPGRKLPHPGRQKSHPAHHLRGRNLAAPRRRPGFTAAPGRPVHVRKQKRWPQPGHHRSPGS